MKSGALAILDLFSQGYRVLEQTRQGIHGNRCALRALTIEALPNHMKPARTRPKLPDKRATNITLSMDVYLATKSLGINTSQVCEQRLREEMKARGEQQWNEEHAAFLDAYDERIAEERVALQELRAF
ncbi:type II toxin-antitoxin system CcdA family antitoxin [Pseudoduganella sp. R-43]|uniref:type II toxin-antitoxin system CcdA family antitoxin n=1 Tax=Pseudoduganella sp. R-43 TaxID=3404063 RepID=UPI003CE9654F